VLCCHSYHKVETPAAYHKPIITYCFSFLPSCKDEWYSARLVYSRWTQKLGLGCEERDEDQFYQHCINLGWLMDITWHAQLLPKRQFISWVMKPIFLHCRQNCLLLNIIICNYLFCLMNVWHAILRWKSSNIALSVHHLFQINEMTEMLAALHNIGFSKINHCLLAK